MFASGISRIHRFLPLRPPLAPLTPEQNARPSAHAARRNRAHRNRRGAHQGLTLADSALRASSPVHLRCTACLSYRESCRRGIRPAARTPCGAAGCGRRAFARCARQRDIGFVFAVRIRQPTALVRHCVPQLPQRRRRLFIPVGCCFISNDVTRTLHVACPPTPVVAKRQTRRTWPVSWGCHETFIFRAGTFSFRA